MKEETCSCNESKKSCKCEKTCNCGCDETCNCSDIKNCECDETCNCSEEIIDTKLEESSKKEKKNKYKKEIENLNNKIKELEDKNLREKADIINYKKRQDENLSRILKYSNEDIIKQILPVIDNFERAIKMDDINLEDQLSKFLSGFKMIYCNLMSTLEKFEIKLIDGNNKPFDPTYHEAVMTEKIDGMETGLIIEVLQKGYILKDKVIRPAMVKVSE